MTNSTVSSNDKLAGLLDEYISNSPKQKIQDIYTKYDLHKYQTSCIKTTKVNSGYITSEFETNKKTYLLYFENMPVDNRYLHL